MADLAVWQRTIVDEKGNIIPGAEVEVRSYPGGSLITLYRGPDGSQTKSNPFRTGEDGFARFWAESQRAEIIAHGAGSTIRWIVDLLNADEVIGDAVSEATAAAANAVSEAKAEADRAEAARDAAQLNAGIYPSTAAGLAATTDGDYFSVPSGSDDEYLILYRNDNGSAVEISRAPSSDAISTLIGNAGAPPDWDAVDRSGFYRSENAAGLTPGTPEGRGLLVMQHIQRTGGRAYQQAMSLDLDDPRMWGRARDTGGTWGAWVRLATTADLEAVQDDLTDQESLHYQNARSVISASGAAERQGFFAAGLLDPLPQPYAAFGMMRLLSGYSGPIGQVRLGSNDIDITADSDGRVSVASAVTGSLNDGQVVAWNGWYDQSGNGRDAYPASGGSPGIGVLQGNAALSRRAPETLYWLSYSRSFVSAAKGMTFGFAIHPRGSAPNDSIYLCGVDSETETAAFRAHISQNSSGYIEVFVNPVGASGFTLQGPAPLTAEWTSVVVRIDYEAGRLDIWQNGENANTTFNPGVLPNSNSNSFLSILNRESNTTSRQHAFRGLVSGVVLYKEALSDAAASYLHDALGAVAANARYGKRLARIAWMTDLHVSDREPNNNRYYRDSLTKMADAVDTWNALDEQPDAVVVGGDLGESGDSDFLDNMASIHSTLSELDTQRIIYLLGNHDLGGPERNSKADVLAALGGYNDKAHGVTYLKGVRLIWLDSNYAADDDDAGYDQLPTSEWNYLDTWIPPSQRRWLEDELGRSMLPTVIFSHNPIDRDHNYSVHNYEEIQRIIRDSGANVLGVIAGHAHTNEAWIVDGIPHYRTEALVKGPLAEDNNAYATIDIYENRLVIHGYGIQASHNTLPA